MTATSSDRADGAVNAPALFTCIEYVAIAPGADAYVCAVDWATVAWVPVHGEIPDWNDMLAFIALE